MSLRHKPELDGIRGLAILGVLAIHCCQYIWITPSKKPILMAMYFGQWGVDLFFALSGFLITGILLETRTTPHYFRSFYMRRILRIWPLYYSVLAVLFGIAAVNGWASAHMPPRSEWPSYLFYLQNVPWFWAQRFVVPVTMLGHFWSLAVEEQFYIVWPLLVWKANEKVLLGLCIAGLVIALPLRLALLPVFGTSWGEMIITTARMDGLLIGASLAILLHLYQRIPGWLAAVSGVLGAGIVATIAVRYGSAEFMGSGPLMRTYGVTAVALLSGSLIAASQLHRPTLDPILTVYWLRTMGRYSYGIYVFHIPIFFFVSGVIAPALGIRLPLPFWRAVPYLLCLNAISIAVAYVSFQYYESRFLRLKSKYKPDRATDKEMAGREEVREVASGSYPPAPRR